MLSGKCSYCNSGEIRWGADFSFEDYGIEGEGVVQTFTCSNEECGVEFETYQKTKE